MYQLEDVHQVLEELEKPQTPSACHLTNRLRQRQGLSSKWGYRKLGKDSECNQPRHYQPHSPALLRPVILVVANELVGKEAGEAVVSGL